MLIGTPGGRPPAPPGKRWRLVRKETQKATDGIKTHEFIREVVDKGVEDVYWLARNAGKSPEECSKMTEEAVEAAKAEGRTPIGALLSQATKTKPKEERRVREQHKRQQVRLVKLDDQVAKLKEAVGEAPRKGEAIKARARARTHTCPVLPCARGCLLTQLRRTGLTAVRR